MWGRNYTSCKKMVTLFRKKGYSTKEAWEIVGAILRDTVDGDDLKIKADKVMPKAEYDEMYKGGAR